MDSFSETIRRLSQGFLAGKNPQLFSALAGERRQKKASDIIGGIFTTALPLNFL
jgi:hypothetical protein